jgi:hypothetical protein
MTNDTKNDWNTKTEIERSAIKRLHLWAQSILCEAHRRGSSDPRYATLLWGMLRGFSYRRVEPQHTLQLLADGLVFEHNLPEPGRLVKWIAQLRDVDSATLSKMLGIPPGMDDITFVKLWLPTTKRAPTLRDREQWAKRAAKKVRQQERRERVVSPAEASERKRRFMSAARAERPLTQRVVSLASPESIFRFGNHVLMADCSGTNSNPAEPLELKA